MHVTTCTDFPGKHYESGTIANLLAAADFSDPITGAPYSEALVLGASGGIAFGYFVFEYSGYLPHVALLTRNTFSPLERALDNLGIRREQFESTNPDKAEDNLKKHLDFGSPVVVWADVFSLPHTGLQPKNDVWAMLPLLIIGYDERGFIACAGGRQPFRVNAEVLKAARSRVKKDRNRMMTIQGIDEDRLNSGLVEGMKTCAALLLDKPPAGSAKNFGVKALEHFQKCLRDKTTADGWTKKFGPGPRFVQAVGGDIGQPGVWQWIEQWGTQGGADRATFSGFLSDASHRLSCPDLQNLAAKYTELALHWTRLAEASLPYDVPELRRLRELHEKRSAILRSLPENFSLELEANAAEFREAVTMASEFTESAPVFEAMARALDPIISGERTAIEELRAILGGI